jgi:hypothetical protein
MIKIKKMESRTPILKMMLKLSKNIFYQLLKMVMEKELHIMILE